MPGVAAADGSMVGPAAGVGDPVSGPADGVGGSVEAAVGVGGSVIGRLTVSVPQ